MRTFISKSLKLVVTLLMGAVFTVIATAPVMAEDLQTVRMQAVSGSVGGIPLMIMANEGLDKKHGFKGEFEFPPHEGASQNFLVGNSDIAMDNDIAGVAIARTEGFEITAADRAAAAAPARGRQMRRQPGRPGGAPARQAGRGSRPAAGGANHRRVEGGGGRLALSPFYHPLPAGDKGGVVSGVAAAQHPKA